MKHVNISDANLRQIDLYFNNYISERKIAGCSLLLWQCGAERYTMFKGVQDLESGTPVSRDTIFRIYSMTKPVASVALMMLWDQGHFDLDDPIARFLPKFNEMTLYCPNGNHVRANGKIKMWHILTHTAGFILPAFSEHPLRHLYISDGVNGSRSEGTLTEVIDRLANKPLLFEPGTRWEYSMATDVVGRLIEVIDGRPFDTFLQEEIFTPIGLVDTGFHLSPNKIPRLAGNYTRDQGEPIRPIDMPASSRYLTVPPYKSGNGGLLSTMDDYLRFCLMLRNRGTLNDVQLLKPETVDLMTKNHLEGDMADMDAANFGGLDWHGTGFGLGFSILLDPGRVGYGNKGVYGWSGAASTYFWVDPVADLIAIFFTQFMPSRTYTIRNDLRPLVYSALALKSS